MVGERIGEYLEANGIMKSYVADKIGISRPKMCDICNKDKPVDAVTYFKICQALNLPLETFFQDDEVM